jgi:hypothetical protein
MGRNFTLLASQVVEAAALYAKGIPMSRVAEIFGVGHDCAKRALIAAGVKIRGQAEQARCRPITLEMIKLGCVVTKTGCWIWSGKPGKTGHGRISRGGESFYVHRKAYELATGKTLRRTIDVRQDCGNRLCCNPECLVASTRKTTVANARLSRGILHSMAVKRGHKRNGYLPGNTLKQCRGSPK